jgi:hypothetical protein
MKVDRSSGHANALEYPAMIETDPNPAQQPSPEANRMRRSRARRRRGETIVTLEVGPDLIFGLVARGWLPEGDRADKGAIARALTQLAERALWANVTPSAGSQGYVCLACDLKATTVDTLISLGWLAAEHANDINEIEKAFRGFAGRALDKARRDTLETQWSGERVAVTRNSQNPGITRTF